MSYNPDLAKRYIEAIKKEIIVRAREYGLDGRPLKTIYFGGGTPSILSSSAIKGIIDLSGRIFGLEDGAEITLEANPDTLDRKKLVSLIRTGINRLSIGVQSFSDRYLNLLGRSHNTDKACRTFKACRSAGFENINLDLIYALPGQRLDEWLLTVEETISLSPEHISIYCLTIEEGTPFHHRLKRGQIKITPEEEQIEMYLAAGEMLKKGGYGHYEISNFSLPGRFCRHNLLYWERDEYLGIGAGAHSYIGNKMASNTDPIGDYISQADSGNIESNVETLTHEDQLMDAIIFGLRKLEGIDLVDIRDRFGIDPLLTFKPIIEKLIRAGMITLSSNQISLTQKGNLLADQVALEFLPA